MPKILVLVVEDEMDTAKVLVKRLTGQGFNVLVAMDAYQATMLTYKENPDLIILDLMLPAGGGLSVLKNIRSNPQKAYIPVVVLTGMKNDEVKKEVLNQGVEAYLEKPYDADNLITTVQNILNKKES
ncbi:MAG: response regulator [Candidatus Omnitrophica bacterium]|nr:response regulator [Candidatus Omnitrophota bacterium]